MVKRDPFYGALLVQCLQERTESVFAGRRTVFAGGFISQQHQSCLLFLVKFLFSRLFLLSSSFAFLLDGKFKRVNVLVPLMPRLFRVLLSESKVPACWKVAKLSPIHKNRGSAGSRKL